MEDYKMDSYTATAYLNNRYVGVMDEFEGDYGSVSDVMWQWLHDGYYVECQSYEGIIRYNPDIMHRLLENYDYIELSDCIDD